MVLEIILAFGTSTAVYALEQSEVGRLEFTGAFNPNLLLSRDNESVPLAGSTHFRPSIACDNEDITFVWENYTGFCLSTSSNSGKSVSNVKPFANFTSQLPDIIKGANNTLHVVFQYNKNLKYIKSVDNGQTFGKTISLTDNGYIDEPQIACSIKNEIYIACWYWPWKQPPAPEQPANIYLFKSLDEGNSFICLGNITSGGLVGDEKTTREDNPALQTDKNGAILVVFDYVYEKFDGVNYLHRDELYFIKSTNGGKSFTSPLRITDTNESEYIIRASPNMALGPNGEIYVSWWDKRDGYARIYFSKSMDGGAVEVIYINP